MAPGYWLLKTEPESFSFEDLWRAPRRTTSWDGVRNYQARNLLRDAMQVGDGVLVYHSNAEPPGVAGFATIASDAYPDPTQFDPADDHFDPGSQRAEPRWIAREVRAEARAPRLISRDDLREHPVLAGMEVLRRGNRLSVQPVSAAEWKAIRALCGLETAPKGPGRGRKSK